LETGVGVAFVGVDLLGVGVARPGVGVRVAVVGGVGKLGGCETGVPLERKEATPGRDEFCGVADAPLAGREVELPLKANMPTRTMTAPITAAAATSR
jgi:hypothetical protein